MAKIKNRNYITLSGTAILPLFDTTALGKEYYSTSLLVTRISGIADYLPVLIPKDMIAKNTDYVGKTIEVKGKLRSWNQKTNSSTKSHLITAMIAEELQLLPNNHLLDPETNNYICLVGFLCKMPNYRITPSGRKVIDLLLAVNWKDEKSDYIPCICWGADAEYAAELKTGDLVELSGRLQSRKYYKKLPDGNTEEKVAYEVSGQNIKLLKAKKEKESF